MRATMAPPPPPRAKSDVIKQRAVRQSSPLVTRNEVATDDSPLGVTPPPALPPIPVGSRRAAPTRYPPLPSPPREPAPSPPVTSPREQDPVLASDPGKVKRASLALSSHLKIVPPGAQPLPRPSSPPRESPKLRSEMEPARDAASPDSTPTSPKETHLRRKTARVQSMRLFRSRTRPVCILQWDMTGRCSDPWHRNWILRMWNAV